MLLMSEDSRRRLFADGEETELGSKVAKGAGIGAAIGGGLGAVLAGLAAAGVIALPGIGLLAMGTIAAALAGGAAGAVAGGGVAKNEIGRHTRDDSHVWRPRLPSATAAGSSRLVAGLPARPAHRACREARSPISRPESPWTRRLRGGAAGSPGSFPPPPASPRPRTS